jgi:hypothetical protein
VLLPKGFDALVFEGGPFPFFRRRQGDDNARKYKARRAFLAVTLPRLHNE